MIVPSIRQDLKLSEGPKKEDGSASWLLYDSLRNKYFSINKKAFDLLKNWSSGIETTEFIEKIKKSNLSITCLLYTSPSPRDAHESRMPSSA